MIWMYNHEWTSHKSLRSLLTHLAVGTATCWWPIHEAALCCWVESSTAQSNATQVSSKLPKWLHHLWLPHLMAHTILFIEINLYTSHGSPSQALPCHRFYNGITRLNTSAHRDMPISLGVECLGLPIQVHTAWSMYISVESCQLVSYAILDHGVHFAHYFLPSYLPEDERFQEESLTAVSPRPQKANSSYWLSTELTCRLRWVPHWLGEWQDQKAHWKYGTSWWVDWHSCDEREQRLRPLLCRLGEGRLPCVVRETDRGCRSR